MFDETKIKVQATIDKLTDIGESVGKVLWIAVAALALSVIAVFTAVRSRTVST